MQDNLSRIEEPSEEAEVLLKYLDPVSRILQLNFGYGNDLKYFLRQGHTIAGIETSIDRFSEVAKELGSYIEAGHATLAVGQYNRIGFSNHSMDGVLYKNSSGLLLDRSLGRAFASYAARVLKPSGHLVICLSDLNRDRDIFANHFDTIDLKKSQKIESQKNPVPSYFTIMVAKRKSSDLSLDLG